LLVNDYSKKVFWEANFDYFENFEELIENGTVPESYAECGSSSCYYDYTEHSNYKPDVYNENLGMAAW